MKDASERSSGIRAEAGSARRRLLRRLLPAVLLALLLAFALCSKPAWAVPPFLAW
jgi:hypothetical protein